MVNTSKYDAIGFDLDNTLLMWKRPKMNALLYETLISNLIEVYGYPFSLREKKFNIDFCQRGLLIDKFDGNILKVDYQLNILRAYHGFRQLTALEIIDKYGKNKNIASDYDKFVNNLWASTFHYYLIRSAFSQVYTFAYANLIQTIDTLYNGEDAHRRYHESFDDLYKAGKEFFNGFDEQYKAAIEDDPSSYIPKIEPTTLSWIKSLKSDGKIVFLLTSAKLDMAEISLSYLIGNDWRDYFHVVCVAADKPLFFTGRKYFTQLNDKNEIICNEKLHLQRAVLGGCWNFLSANIKFQLKRDFKRCLYFGDSVSDDLYPVRRFINDTMDTVAVVQELDSSHVGKSEKFWGSFFETENEKPLMDYLIKFNSIATVATIDAVAKKSSNSVHGH